MQLIPSSKKLIASAIAFILGVGFVAPVEANVQRGYVPSRAIRVMDTRIEDGGPKLEAEEVRRLHLISRVPLGATAVELNITALDATDPTRLVVWPAGKPRPYTTNLLVGPDEVRSNTVLVELGDLYSVDLYNDAGELNVIVDVIGWFTGDFAGMRPMRMVDTRFGYGGRTVVAGADQNVIIGGRFDVPADAKAVAMNVSIAGATEPSSIILWPAGSPKPLVGMMPVVPGGIQGQSVIVGLEYGMFSMSATTGSFDVIVDVTGWFRSDGRFVAIPAQRIVDTKVGTCGIELGPGEIRTFPVTDAPDVFAVAVNIGAVDASQNTYLTVWGTDAPQTTTSNLNVMPGPTPVGAVVITELGEGGQISLFNAAGKVHVTLDVIGVFTGTTPSGQRTPCPLPPPPAPVDGEGGASNSSGASGSAPAPTTTKPAESWQSMMIKEVNQRRQAAGLGTVAPCGNLNRNAQSYSEVLVGTGDISHTGPDGSTLPNRVAVAGYVGWSNLGENLAAGQGTVEAVMNDWMNSDGHRANILKPEFTHIGLGRTKGIYKANSTESWFWVQVFGSGGSC